MICRLLKGLTSKLLRRLLFDQDEVSEAEKLPLSGSN
ncbi:hypothetical protein PSE_3123 [Pseudovibrio sp. FO-BEG1]|nr:hypothetical protein PSE_3123 [Pseudovibrio sp. FO-BEG1]